MVKEEDFTFIRVTNQMIYKDIQEIKRSVGFINTISKVNSAGIGILFAAVLFILQNIL